MSSVQTVGYGSTGVDRRFATHVDAGSRLTDWLEADGSTESAVDDRREGQSSLGEFE
ncbi:hypothetical protein [Halohasta litchfieldiae]|jgi:hypothetical protein|uniref:hypothetical protein n=1 Tax=Halohasta litchfieldiae TaxID=1073996 RepID=UPI0013A53775|nr:hypothetical protein [Halohasta litchfieldiae]